MLVYILIGVFFIILLCGCIVFIKYNNLSDLENSIYVCGDKIDEILENKKKLVDELLDMIKDDKLKDSFLFDNDNIYDRESSLFNIRWDINKYFIDNEDKINKDIKDLIKKLDRIEDNIEGLKDFYNANVINYNELLVKKPFNLIFKLFKFDNIKTFKIRRIDDYEILKD